MPIALRHTADPVPPITVPVNLTVRVEDDAPRLASMQMRDVAGVEEREAHAADHFWVTYAPENHASGSGIPRAGFVNLAALSFLPSGQPALADLLSGGAEHARALMGVATSVTPLAPCWRCV